MRHDLNKLLCERERYGGKSATYRRHRKSLKVDLDLPEVNFGGIEKMRKIYGWHRKEFNENLNPLKGLLRKNVGRKWNDFYSELMQNFDTRSVINRHILEHLYSYCPINLRRDNVGLYKLGWGRSYLHLDHYTPYYVDPDDGIIKHNSGYRIWRTGKKKLKILSQIEQAKTERKISKDECYRKINDVWFHVTLIRTQESYLAQRYNRKLHEYEFQQAMREVISEIKRTCSKKEKKLNNLD